MNNKIDFTFLICSERSGSNFITKLLNNHSKICGPSTKHIINPLTRNYFRYQPFSNEKNWDDLLNDILNVFHVPFTIWKADFSFKELKSSIPRGDLRSLIDFLYIKEARANRKKHIFLREAQLYEFYPFLKFYFPEANFVYLVRDPRDMALSWKKSETHKGGVIAAARQWKKDQQQSLKIVALEEAKNNIVQLSYENLINNTEENLNKILQLNNFEFESGMTQMNKDALTAKNAKGQKVLENISKPIMKNNFNKWKKQLTENEINFIEHICYYEMLQLGYKPKNKWSELKNMEAYVLEQYHKKELQELEYNPSVGVIENMKAKKKFYQKYIN